MSDDQTQQPKGLSGVAKIIIGVALVAAYYTALWVLYPSDKGLRGEASASVRPDTGSDRGHDGGFVVRCSCGRGSSGSSIQGLEIVPESADDNSIPTGSHGKDSRRARRKQMLENGD